MHQGVVAVRGVDKGFFYVSGHGVGPELLEAAFAEARTFFALPAAEKQRVAMTTDNYGRGYEDVGGQTLEAGAPPDLKEGYYLGRESRDDDTCRKATPARASARTSGPRDRSSARCSPSTTAG
ncbi:2-oxoglutarate and iron-dependent oxygenase domain-containing protein [Pseudonocardia sp. RS010]|uniref:2-oxoglutarate and iron-dependent oxygenase domain-containing protein n=1 Tax=Pseudonocardia sp. RS010 TaxID=3385979 RepID=UPI0039A2676E